MNDYKKSSFYEPKSDKFMEQLGEFRKKALDICATNVMDSLITGNEKTEAVINTTILQDGQPTSDEVESIFQSALLQKELDATLVVNQNGGGSKRTKL